MLNPVVPLLLMLIPLALCLFALIGGIKSLKSRSIQNERREFGFAIGATLSGALGLLLTIVFLLYAFPAFLIYLI